MPFLVGLRNGPSQCAPRDSDPSSASRSLPDGPRYGRAWDVLARCDACNDDREDALKSYLLIHLGFLAGQRRQVRCYSRFDQAAVDPFEFFTILSHVTVED